MRFVSPLFLLAFAFFSTGCLIKRPPPPPPIPVAALDFSRMQPLALRTGKVDISQSYDPMADPEDASERFAQPPHTALMDYARRRLVAAGGEGVLRFTIADARVAVREVEQSNPALRWAGIGREDEYSVFVTLEIEAVPLGSRKGPVTEMRFERSLVLPQRLPVEERWARQQEFLEGLIDDVDVSVTRALAELSV